MDQINGPTKRNAGSTSLALALMVLGAPFWGTPASATAGLCPAGFECAAPATGSAPYNYLYGYPPYGVPFRYPTGQDECQRYLGTRPLAQWNIYSVVVDTRWVGDGYECLVMYEGMQNAGFSFTREYPYQAGCSLVGGTPSGTGPNKICVGATTCPAPSTNPNVPYTYVSADQLCERPSQCLPPNVINPNSGRCEPPETYTVTLIPDGPTTEPLQALGFTITVKNQEDQPPKNSVTVHLALTVGSTSGGHSHGDNTRPRGALNTTTCASDATCIDVSTSTPDNGTGRFTFNPTDASGTHIITATCDRCGNTATAEVKVMVKEAQAGDLNPIPESLFYTLKDSKGKIIGAIEKTHEDNHHLTAAAVVKLERFAKAYQTKTNPGKVLYLNDASLEWGGLYDVGSAKWKPPHKGHRHGREIDIRAAAAANGDPVKEGAIPFDLFFPVWKLARDQRIKADLHCMENRQLVIGSSCYWLPEARHFHVNLN